ncbi:MAG: SHOCT domain-containing protein [Candidatus Dormibacteria bacterium]
MISLAILRPFGFGGWLLGLIVLLMLVGLGLRIIGFSRRRHYFKEAARGRASSPEQILARRFAAGEIDEEDYRRRLAALRNSIGPP